MKLLREGELEFVFGEDWAASRLDEQGGVPIPHGMALVDFVAEGGSPCDLRGSSLFEIQRLGLDLDMVELRRQGS